MTDRDDGNGNGSQAAPGEPHAAHVSILAQYVKDLSFENPGAPFPPNSSENPPRIDIAVDVQASRRDQETFEVELKLSADAKVEGQPVFVVEVVYGGLFLLRNFPQDSLEPFLLIEGPRLLFPFVRRIVADLTRDGGFPPLMVEPIDFSQLYRQRLEQHMAERPQA